MSSIKSKDHSHADVEPFRSIVLGTAGHIDHGKTALVYALTGMDTDRLAEEKRRGISIDLGFAAMQLHDGSGSEVHVGLVDVPGHHAFIRNMLAGTGGIDCVILVIAADEGVKAQTEEHLRICELLGIQRGIVVLTKKDAVSPDQLALTRTSTEQFLQRSFLEHAPTVAVSAKTGEGVAELKQVLAQVVLSIPEKSDDFVPRVPVDRVFSMRGFGTVATGTLQSGAVRTDEVLEVQPGGRAVRVRGLQVHGAACPQAHGPSRVALNLSGIEVSELHRGDTLVPAKTLQAISHIDVLIEALPGAPAIRHRSKVRLHAFASESLATVLLYDLDQAAGTNQVLARLRLEKPVLVLPGDRFVLRQCSPATTIAGGRVLDAAPLTRMRKAQTRAWLESVVQATDREHVLRLRVARRGTEGVSVAQLVAETGLRTERVAAVLDANVASGVLVRDRSATHYVASSAIESAREAVKCELERLRGKVHHKAELSSKCKLPGWIFDMALEQMLASHSIYAEGEGLTLTAPTSGGAQNDKSAEVEAFYAEAGLVSPLTSEVASRLSLSAQQVREIVTALLRTKRLVRMGADNLLIHADALRDLTANLQKHRGEQFDVARFKSFTGLTRKHAIPLLEYLDGARITRNAGGIRTVL